MEELGGDAENRRLHAHGFRPYLGQAAQKAAKRRFGLYRRAAQAVREEYREVRPEEDGLSPEEPADGLNSVFYGSRSRIFPNKEAGNSMLLRPVGEYAWKGVIAPHDHFSGLVTGYRYPLKSAKKELEKLSEGRFTPHVPHPVKGSDAQPKRFSAVESDSKLFSDSSIP